MPGLWGAGLGFFAVNIWILGIVVQDVRMEGWMREEVSEREKAVRNKGSVSD